MMWLRAILAAVGILYEIIMCAVCRRQATVKKGNMPSGWACEVQGSERKFYCPECGP